MIWLALGIAWAALALFAGLLIRRKEKRFYRWAVVLTVFWTAIILFYGQVSPTLAFRHAANFAIVLTGCMAISLTIEILVKRRRR